MRDEDHRQRQLSLEALEELEHLRLHHDVERSRRLVCDEDPWVARERERDEDTLALACRRADAESRPPACAGMPTVSSSSAMRLVESGDCAMELDRLRDLVSDGLDRIERVQRPLEDDRHLGPAHRAQATGLHREHVLAVEQHLARHLGSAWEHTQQRAGDRRLPAARLPGEPERLSGGQVERDSADCRHRPGLRAVGHVEVANGEERRRHGHRRLTLSSRPEAAGR